jgi:hypothetical protein
MRWLRVVVQDVWGLFVDDGRFALSILIWLAVGWMLPRLGLPPVLACVLFAVGLAVLLIVSAAGRAGQRQ